jgi:hypothetical protein
MEKLTLISSTQLSFQKRSFMKLFIKYLAAHPKTLLMYLAHFPNLEYGFCIVYYQEERVDSAASDF